MEHERDKTIEEDGMTIKIKWAVDEYSELPDHVGSYLNAPDKSRPFVNRKTGLLFTTKGTEAVRVSCLYEKHQYEYWQAPDNGYKDASYLVQDFDRAESFGNSWEYLTCMVTVAVHDSVIIGSKSLGGIDSDSGEEHFSQLEKEVIAEAMHEAATALKKLLNGAPKLLAALEVRCGSS